MYGHPFFVREAARQRYEGMLRWAEQRRALAAYQAKSPKQQSSLFHRLVRVLVHLGQRRSSTNARASV